MHKQGQIPSFLLLVSGFHTKENVLKSITFTQLTTDSDSNVGPNNTLPHTLRQQRFTCVSCVFEAVVCCHRFTAYMHTRRYCTNALQSPQQLPSIYLGLIHPDPLRFKKRVHFAKIQTRLLNAHYQACC